jgi:hypothetical protein
MLLGEASWTLHGAWELTELGGAGGRRGGNGDGGEQTTGSPMTETAEADDGRPGSFYPVIQVGDEPVPLDLSAFLGEPSVNEIGEPGEALKRLIKRISYRLEMPEGEYCGAFLIAAAQVIGARASLVGIAETTRGATPRQVQPGSGNLGDVDLQPEQTPAVRLLRFIAGVCPLVTELSRLMGSVYALPYVRSLIRGRYNNHHIGWMLHFHMEHTPAMRDSIAHLYMRACQVVMLQLLRASRVEIDKRLANFDRYFVLFESLMTGLVASEAKLQRMRELLNQIEAATLSSGQAVISEVYETWRGARQAFSTSMHDQVLNAATMISTPQAPAGQPLRLSDGTWVIVDDDGRQWTRQELEQAIAMRSGAATSIDPLVHQLSNVPEVVNVFRSFPAMAKEYTRHLLKEMQDNNAEIQGKVIDSYEYAFRSGKIREDLPSRTVPGTFIAMQGIHLLAHQAIGDAFEGSNWYAVGIDFAFSAELGRLSLISFAEFGLILTLSVLCPPLGAAAGFVSAEVHYAEAQERMRIYKSVIDPEQLYSKAELELDLFMAELELALSIIPELGSIGRGAVKGATAIGRHGVRGGLVRISVQARRALFVSIGRQAKQGLAKAFVTALVTDRMMALVLPHLLGPVIEGVEAEIRGQTAPPPLAGQAALAGPPPAEEGEEITSPDGIAFLSRLDEYTPGPEEERLPPAEEAP